MPGARRAGLADELLVAGDVGRLVDGARLVGDAPLLDVGVGADRVAAVAAADVLVAAHHHLRRYVDVWCTVSKVLLYLPWDQLSKFKVYVHYLVSTVRLQRVPLAYAA